MEGEMMNKEGGRCKCFHHKVAAWSVFLIGLMFLLHNAFGWLSEGFVMVAWPLLLTVAGCVWVCSKAGMCKCCDGGSCGDGRCC